MNTKDVRPEPNRLIRCKGFDWSPFECVGKWVPYKKGSTKKQLARGGRFMRRERFGIFVADSDTWKDVETWEYVTEPETKTT